MTNDVAKGATIPSVLLFAKLSNNAQEAAYRAAYRSLVEAEAQGDVGRVARRRTLLKAYARAADWDASTIATLKQQAR